MNEQDVRDMLTEKFGNYFKHANLQHAGEFAVKTMEEVAHLSDDITDTSVVPFNQFTFPVRWAYEAQEILLDMLGNDAMNKLLEDKKQELNSLIKKEELDTTQDEVMCIEIALAKLFFEYLRKIYYEVYKFVAS
mgnify:CR=1 FL=1